MSRYLDLLRRARAEMNEPAVAPGHEGDTQPEQVASGAKINEAESILAICAERGVAIRLDPDGTVILGRAGATADENSQPWPALIAAIEAHLDAVADLIAAGWHLRADFPSPAEEEL